MKPLVSFYRRIFARPGLLLAVTLLKFVLLILIAHWLTPPIPCNTYVQGVNCVAHSTTERHLADILISASTLAFVGAWTLQRYRQRKNDPPVANLTDALYGGASLALVIYLALAITRLVQAG